MSYTIRNADGTILLSLADNTVDRTTTSLSLVGKNIRSYGEYFNNNLIQILSNSANTQSNPPRNPLKGQLWYDTTFKKLKIYDGIFKPLSGAIISGSEPADFYTGDLWFDSKNNQLKMRSGQVTYLIGPAYPADTGETGWVLPQTSIKDTTLAARKVVLLKSYGNFIGIASRTEFTMSQSDSLSYFNTSTTSTVVSGLTIFGDIKYTGQITNKYLSMSIDLAKSSAANQNFGIQNQIIAENYLTRMFPVDASSETPGLPIGTEARVLCTGASLLGNTFILDDNIQIRRFRIEAPDDPKNGTRWWRAYPSTNNTV